MDEKAIENSLFTWKSWDSVDTADFVFYDVELVRDIGILKKGQRFPVANLLLSRSLVEFIPSMDNPEETWKFTLKLETI